MTPTLTTLQHRWQRKTGSPMPEAIARLDLPTIERAVKLTYEGHIVFVPVEPVDNLDGYWNGDSMREWDSDSQW
jgi:hypothetical protein